MLLSLTLDIKNKLAEENMALVYHVVKNFANTGVPHDELCSVAYVGYAKALDTYDTGREVKFSTYAYNCMKNEILFFLRKEKKHKDNNVSINKTLSTDKNGNSLQLGATISNEDFGDPSIEEKLILDETIEYLKGIIDSLSPTEQYIIIHRFGINGSDIKTQKQIADYIGMSQANVSKLEKTITDKIKRLLGTKHKIRNFHF